MKAPEKSKMRKQKIKKKVTDGNTKEQVLVVAQEFKFARLLSGNEKKTRDRVLKTLKKWLLNCFQKGYEFKEDDFIRVWKGLFYAVWMSDKPLVQEDLCESIAEILDLFPPEQLRYALMMTKAGFKVLATEWYGIDQHRMDKFLMLVRRYLRGSLRCLARCKWSLQSCQEYSRTLMASDGLLCVKTPQYARNSTSLILHYIDCYLEELAKVSRGEIEDASVAALLRPFTSLVCEGEALVVCVAARRLLTALLRQSELGLQYMDATRAWQKMGCPAGGPEALELVSDDEGDTDAPGDVPMEEPPSALDPRAGRVNVTLPLLPVPAGQLASQLREGMAGASSKAYRRAKICLERFEALSRDKYPLVIPEAEASGAESPIRLEPTEAAEKLKSLEKTLVAQSDELALRGLKRKHRKRLLAKSRAGLSIMEDVIEPVSAQTKSTIGDWQIEDTDPDVSKNKKQKKNCNEGNEVVKKIASRKRKALESDPEAGKKAKSKANNLNGSKVLDNSKVNNAKVNGKSNNSVKGNGKINDNVKVNGKNNDSVKVNGKNNDCVKVNGKNNDDIKVNGKSNNKSKVNGHMANDKAQVNGKKTNKTNLEKAVPKRKVKNAPKIIDIDSNKSMSNDSKKDLVNTKTGADKVSSKDGLKKKSTDVINKLPAINDNTKSNKRQKVLPLNKIKNYQKKLSPNQRKSTNDSKKKDLDTPKKVKFVLKNNSMQGTMDYYKSIKQSPSIPFDSSKKPSKTNLKISSPSPINPFFKKKLKVK